jgi:peptidoglycan/LPS O-acetylase OafA/YrhL
MPDISTVREHDGTDKRMSELDALRGCAAVSVLLHHFASSFIERNFGGRQAVILFFILSGYVLALPVWKGQDLNYGRYLIRRLCRIYLPFLGALILAVLGAWTCYGSTLPLSPWFYRTWHTPISVNLLLAQMFMAPTPELNTAFWSLRYEIVMSVLLPGIWAVMSRYGTWLIAIVAAFSYWIDSSRYLGVLHWGPFFVLGSILSLHREAVRLYFAGRNRSTKLLTALISVIAYMAPRYAHLPMDAINGLGGAGMICLALYSRMTIPLKTPALQYLGRISYSIYLIHGTVLFALLVTLYHRVSLFAIVALYIVGTLCAAHLFCVFVEEPSGRLGRRIAANGRASMRPLTPMAPAKTEARSGWGEAQG